MCAAVPTTPKRMGKEINEEDKKPNNYGKKPEDSYIAHTHTQKESQNEKKRYIKS